MPPIPSASYSQTIRLVIPQQPGSFARVATAIGNAGGILGAIDLVRVEEHSVVRDVTVACTDAEQGARIVTAVEAVDGITVVSVSDRTFLLHKGGKIEVRPKTPLKTRDDLSMAYTPGVARICIAIHEDPAKAWALTIKRNTVAVVSDGTAVLGLGDIGPEAAMPVMEGKAMLFKEFGDVDAWPICLATKDVDEIVAVVRAIAPGFGGVNLEDISAPRCFEIERRLREELDIPVFHDDQHGTAIVVLAALENALKVVGKDAEDVRVVVVGAGAAGVACTDIMLARGVRDIVGCDRRGRRARRPRRPDAGQARLRRAHEPARADRHGRRGAGGRGRLRRPGRPGRREPRRRARDERRRDRLRHGQPDARGAAGGGAGERRRHRDRPQRLPEPDQQRARLPRRLPRRARRARDDDRRGDEARRRAGHRRGHRAGGADRRSTSSRASSTGGSARRWRRRSRVRPSSPASRAAPAPRPRSSSPR